MLNEEAILAGLVPALVPHVAEFRLHDTVDSTNERLLQAQLPAERLGVCIAQAQTAGRGRQGRTWQTPPGSGLCLSVATSLAAVPPPGITLAAGVVIRHAVAATGASIQLKWPNDLVVGGGKLGGLLAETRAEEGGVRLVIGLGLNLALPADFRLAEDAALPPTDLVAAGAAETNPNRLSARLVNALGELLLALPHFDGKAYAREFAEHDALLGEPVTFMLNGARQEGIARGVTAAGELIVATGDRMEHLQSGEVQVRPLQTYKLSFQDDLAYRHR